MTLVLPAGWRQPSGYSHGVTTAGRLLFVSGQIGWDVDGRFGARDIVGQARQALQNVVTIVAAAGGRADHITRLTWFITDKRAYLGARARLGAAYREVMGRHFPAMSVVVVAALLEEEALVEIEATAVIPESADGSTER